MPLPRRARQPTRPCRPLSRASPSPSATSSRGSQRFGVKKIEPLGKKFDPNLQEALFEIPDESVPSGTVLQVVEQGFTIGDRVLRPAKVGVSRGGPKTVN